MANGSKSEVRLGAGGEAGSVEVDLGKLTGQVDYGLHCLHPCLFGRLNVTVTKTQTVAGTQSFFFVQNHFSAFIVTIILRRPGASSHDCFSS